MEIFSCNTYQVLKTLTKFKEQAYSGSFRNDGKLLVAGSAEGRVKLFDVGGKGLLRTFTGHKRLIKYFFPQSNNIGYNALCYDY